MNGKDGATTDEATIREWWRLWPKANIGGITGPKSGRWALDVDPRNGGDKTLAALLAEHGDLPRTQKQRTGGGGDHHIFEWPDNFTGKLAASIGRGLDIKGDGGYIVLPPSTHDSGEKDQWADSVPPTVAPQWLWDLAKKSQSKKTASDSATLPNGKRNNTLASRAGMMRRRGFDADAIYAALLVENEKKCDPPLSDEDVKRIAQSISRYAPKADESSTAPSEHKSGAESDRTAETRSVVGDQELTLSQLLIQLARDSAELFHDAGGDAYLTATVDGHKENYRLGSRDSKDWLAGLLYRETERAASGDKINEALSVLRAIARHDSAEIETHVRIAGHHADVYLDLCDKDWRQVKIDQDGWKVIESADSPVRFVRAKGMLPLPEPRRGGSVDDLRGLLNLPADDADTWPMILGWLIAAFRPCNGEGFDYPLLAIHGEQGSAKSSAQRILRDLIDPNKATLRAAPRNERDLAIAAAHGRIISCDNLTLISENLSNAFCRLATGGGFATRELFTDDGEVIFDAQRPVILNGIAEVVTKSDLLDRTLLAHLPVIEPKNRLRKRVLNRKFADARPRILGALLGVVSAGLKRLDEGVEMDEWPRMSDFAEWVIACETALGLKDGAFIAAYRRNIGLANGLAIDSSLVARAIIELIDGSEDHCFEGTIGGLLEALNAKREAAGQGSKSKDDWPTTPEQLRADLVKLAPNLRREKIAITFGRRSNKGRRVTIARLVVKQPSQPSHRHQPNKTNGLQSDGLGDGLDFGETPTVTAPRPPKDGDIPSDGIECDEKADRHPDRHSVNHSKQKASDGVTVVTVISKQADPTPDREVFEV